MPCELHFWKTQLNSFHGVHPLQALLPIWCACPCVCPVSLCVRDKERAWFGLSSLKPKELLFWNASWIVLMIFFFLLGASFTKHMVIFGLFLLVLKTVAHDLPYKPSPHPHHGLGVRKGGWWSQRNLASMNVFQGPGHIPISHRHACFIKIKVKLLFN